MGAAAHAPCPPAYIGSPTRRPLPAARQALRGGSPAVAALMAREAVDLLFYGPRERALGTTDLPAQPGLTLVYDEDGVEFFRVNA